MFTELFQQLKRSIQNVLFILNALFKFLIWLLVVFLGFTVVGGLAGITKECVKNGNRYEPEKYRTVVRLFLILPFITTWIFLPIFGFYDSETRYLSLVFVAVLAGGIWIIPDLAEKFPNAFISVSYDIRSFILGIKEVGVTQIGLETLRNVFNWIVSSKQRGEDIE